MDKMALGNDVAAINNLVGFLNSPLNAGELAPGEISVAEAMANTLPDANEQASQAAANPRARQPVSKIAALPEPEPTLEEAPGFNMARAFYTGRLCVGKDYVAKLTGAKIEGFAEPLYALAEYFFGVKVTADKNKDLPGMRAFLQTVGQWGRGAVSKEYPFSAARAAFIGAVRSAGANDEFSPNLGVNWADYGCTENLWLNAALVRIAVAKHERVAITNVRFSNEHKELMAQGFVNWHVMTSPKEWQERLEKRGLKVDAPVLKDTSEQLAAHLDRQVIDEISRSKNGRKLRVIWNSATPCPSARLWTVSQFLAAAKVDPVTGEGGSDDSGVFIGE
jgi:hypothetical protein